MNNEMTTDNMSNEEVIEVLKGIVFNGFDRTTRKERQALHLAIKALEEQAKKGDLISREQIRKSLNEAFGCESATKYGNKNAEQQYKSYSTLMLYEIADIVEDCCDNAPTIEAPKIDCQSCQYLKFTEQFVENIVKVMIANDITTIEELKKRIGGSE